MLEGRVGLADRFERTADGGDTRRRQAELLQFGGGGLVADVQRPGEQRRLRQLSVLDAGERAGSSRTAASRCGRNRRLVDLLASDNCFDQRLALLNLARPCLERVAR